MNWLFLVSYFFGGVFAANAIPHFVAGMMGRAFQTPFAKPPVKGLSSSTINVLWGFFNAIVGYLLVAHVGDFHLRSWTHILGFGLGILLISLTSARHFGQFHGVTRTRARLDSLVIYPMTGTFRSLKNFNFRL